jgi:uncharacterized protein DUF2752
MAGPARAGRWRWAQRALLALAGIVALWVWRCPIAMLTGLPCPGCGLTRAALALVTGDLAGALALHPLSPALIPFGAWLAGRELACGTGRPEPRGTRSRRGGGRLASVLAGGLVGLLLLVWLARFCGAFGGPVQVDSHLHG